MQATLIALALLTLLHFLRADLEPAWHFVSEYELGPFGWMMRVAFFLMAVGNSALLVSLHSDLPGISGWIARVLFSLGALGLVLGGLFVPDAMNTAPAQASTTGLLHNLGGGLGLPGLVGTFIISVKLWRKQEWRLRRGMVMLATGLLTICFLISFIGIAAATAQSQGVFGPETLVGWPNRIGVLGGCLWVMLIAQQVRVGNSQPAAS